MSEITYQPLRLDVDPTWLKLVHTATADFEECVAQVGG